MDTKYISFSMFAAVAVMAVATAQSVSPQDSPADRVNRMSEADQIALVKAILDHGLPNEQQSGYLYAIIVARSSLVLPMMERKIEDVLGSPSPKNCFTDKEVDPQRVVFDLSVMMTQAGDLQALQEASKLLRIDEKRFDRMVASTLIHAINRGNPFKVAYQGLDIGDPAVDKRIMAWVERELAKPEYFCGPGCMRRRWAEALLDRYGSIPAQSQWSNDPIVSRLRPETAKSLRPDVNRLTTEEWDQRKRK